MNRIEISPRKGWQNAVEKIGFGFHSTETPYWYESAYYSLTLQEIEAIEKATEELWELCLLAVQRVLDEKLYSSFHIPSSWIPLLERSWQDDHPTVYGRFDLAYSNDELKMLEFNADTPTSLYEAGIVQWFWLQEFNPLKDQFNSIHEKLLDYWQSIAPKLNPGVLHFSCIKDSLEDLTNVEYLRDCAIQAGLETEFVFMEDIGWDHLRKIFEDLNELPIKNLFKLYPWEWIIHEPFGPKLWSDRNQVFWIEPPWKMILSNKAILPLLWQMNPGHPLLLPAYFDDHGMTRYVRKPLLSREGANVEIIVETGLLQASGGDYGEEGYVFQQYSPLPDYGGNRPILGTWIIGGQAAGMGIRECDRLITDNSSRFVPHLIDA